MDLNIKKLAEKTKVEYIILIGNINKPVELYDKNGNKIAACKHIPTEYIKFLKKQSRNEKDT